ncbi:MAG: threonine aldolase family protein [Beijerinckiaceae bacterium]
MILSLDFASDNAAGVSPVIEAALAAANRGYTPAYGADAITAAAVARLKQIFARDDLAGFLVSTGTGANALALGAVVPPWGAVLAHEEAHIVEDEVGAPEMFTHGAKMIGMPGEGCKITPDALRAMLKLLPRGAVRNVQPAALSLSQGTEAGTIYTPDEVRALAAIAHDAGMVVHMDGARFSNSVAALGVTPAAMTWEAGVDVLSLGATKNGCWACEAVIFFDGARAADFPFQRKRGGHTLSKGRFLGAQMEAWLKDDHWLALARHANACATRLEQGLLQIPGVRLAWPRQINEVFPILPAPVEAAMRAVARYYPWAGRSVAPERAPKAGEAFVRLICSFQTREEDVDALVAAARRGAGLP